MRRREELRVLVQRANERWAAKGSLLDAPRVARVGIGNGDGDGDVRGGVRGEDGAGVKAVGSVEDVATAEEAGHHEKGYRSERPGGPSVEEREYKEDPWKQARGAPSEEWQPQAWSPDVAATRQ